jgi:TPR repeat protein
LNIIGSLGNFYFTGDGDEKRAARAIALYKRTGDSGDTNATIVLRYRYFTGDGVEKSVAKADELYTPYVGAAFATELEFAAPRRGLC